MKSKLLNLTGAELRQELDRIIVNNPRQRKRWTEKEDVILRVLFGKVPRKVIVKELGRTLNSVDRRAELIGLSGK